MGSCVAKESPLGEALTGGDILSEVELGTKLGLSASEAGVEVFLQRTGDPTTAKKELAGSVCRDGVGDGGTGMERMGDGERQGGLVGMGDVISGIGEGGCGENGKDADCRGSEISGERGKRAGGRLNCGAGAKSFKQMEDS